MSIKQTLEHYDLFDNAILRHGFTEYNRDYVIVADLYYADEPGQYHFLFRGCVEAHYESTMTRDAFSMDDVWIDEEAWQDLDVIDKHVWGVRYVDDYPGWTLIEDSERAQSWKDRLDHDMHELLIETYVFNLRLIFHDLRVTRVGDIAP